MYQLPTVFYAAGPLLQKPIGYGSTVSSGAIVNHDDFYVFVCLLTYRLQSVCYVLGLVVKRYDDGY